MPARIRTNPWLLPLPVNDSARVRLDSILSSVAHRKHGPRCRYNLDADFQVQSGAQLRRRKTHGAIEHIQVPTIQPRQLSCCLMQCIWDVRHDVETATRPYPPLAVPCHILASRSSYGGSASVPTTEPFLVPSPCLPPNSARTRSPRDQGRTITRSESAEPASLPTSRCASSPVDWIPFCDGGLVCVSTEGATLACGGARTIGHSPPLSVGLLAVAGERSGGGGREWGCSVAAVAARCWRRRRVHLQRSERAAMTATARTIGRAMTSPLEGCV